MLTSLHISNLAVLAEVEVELGAGFSALTGETGAGKSMLVDGLALALGARTDSSVVRAGAARAEVNATFEVSALPHLRQWLTERDLDATDECQLRRVVTAEGRSRGYINGQPVPLDLLREAGSQLVEICGQHAHQSLLQRAAQRELLDAHGGHAALLAATANAHRDWSALEAERRRLLGHQEDRQARRELLAYQVTELRGLALQEGEVEALELERRLLANAGRISSGINLALERLYDADEGSAHDLAGSAEREITALVELDPALQPAIDALAASRIHLAEAAEQLRRRLDAIEHDPRRLDAVEMRLAAVDDLARKHRLAAESLGPHLQALERELAGIDASDERLGSIAEECAAKAKAFRSACAQLSAARSKAAQSLARAVTANLRQLGMPDCRFEASVTALAGDQAGPAGGDAIEFLVAPNAGQPPGPVAKVASGGELSRLSLAIQVVAMASRSAPTLIFDEVDAGIGGAVAEIVGRSLQQLSRQRQVLCVTHLPQVASQANHHFMVCKLSAGGTVSTTIAELDAAQRVEEIARMLGGVRITERSRAHAREMLSAARPRRAG